ncbi:methyltransferase family protein [Paenibacillus methanolicus]|uniref:Methyltransferase family protein n=2 Tax=Paenibacillus methanolicus TaxID=582686 RepID=A0A5S5C5X5_9BACL|nr:methyltransferase family protein [Paenibacillus methanolicus]
MERMERIRQAEKQYHDELFNAHRLFEPGSWMSKPVGAVMEHIDELLPRDGLQVLDLGCGPGRHSIPIARRIGEGGGLVTGVDLLESAVAKLGEYSREYGVERWVRGVRCDIESYRIEEGAYDYIIAVSSLEHLPSEEALTRKLAEMAVGTKSGGINVLLVNASIKETAVGTGERLAPMFELNLTKERLRELLTGAYAGWEVLSDDSKQLVFPIDRDGRQVELASDCVTFAARKP